MDVTMLLLVAALLTTGWLLVRRRATGDASSTAAPVDPMDAVTPKPIAPRLAVDGWDGYAGLQRALCVKLAEGMYFPIVEAGAAPPVAQTRTFSTSHADQTSLEIDLYACEPDRPERADFVLRVVVGPIPVTGAAIREIEMTFAIDETGAVAVDGRVADGIVPVEIAEEGSGALPIGPSR